MTSPNSALALPPTQLYIDGKWRTPVAGGTTDAVNPATEATIATVPEGTVADADAAIAAARRAFDDGSWPRLSGKERGAALLRLRQALADRYDDLVALIVAEAGTPLALARGHHVALPIEHLDYWAEAARQPELTALPPRPVVAADGSGKLGAWAVRREPIGVVAAITAYNFPLLLSVMKLGPALAAGNTVVLKPSPYTPLTALAIAAAAEEAGFPPGVVNVVTGGSDVGTALTTDPRVDLVSFTGSDVVGAAIVAQSAPTLKRVVLELGGKSPLIVRDDGDLDLAAAAGLTGFTTQAGQGCALTTRHLVHERIYDAYVERVAAAAAALRIGDPADPGTQMGPLIREAARQRVEGFIHEAVGAGAQVVTGGGRPDGPGYFVQPTLIAGAAPDLPVVRREIFGPVGVVIPFSDDDEAVRLANDSEYGLDGHIISADTARAFDIACRLRTGSVSINGGSGYTSPQAPMGGYKRSGIGRENGTEGLDEYRQLKTIRFHAG
jgi:aldehyde dehydrogenase (NAD+)